MIKLQNLTPAIYYTQSRDFQFIGRLYDIVLNAIKTNVDTIRNIPNGKNIDEGLLNLLAMSLGFKAQHSYNATHLAAICSVLPKILRQKGSLNSIITAVNALLCAEGIAEPFNCILEAKEKLVLYLPEQLSDLTLLKDLMNYILPAGLSCKLIKKIEVSTIIKTEVYFSDSVEVYTKENTISNSLAPNLTSILRVRDKNEISFGEVADHNSLIANSTIAQAQQKEED